MMTHSPFKYSPRMDKIIQIYEDVEFQKLLFHNIILCGDRLIGSRYKITIEIHLHMPNEMKPNQSLKVDV